MMYVCDPAKNAGCTKESCGSISGGGCFATTDPEKAVQFDGAPVRYADRLRQVRLSVEIAQSQGVLDSDEAGERIARLTEEIRLAELVDDKERNREAQEKAERAQMLAELEEAKE